MVGGNQATHRPLPIAQEEADLASEAAMVLKAAGLADPMVLANVTDSWEELVELLDMDLLASEVAMRVKRLWESASFDAVQAVRNACMPEPLMKKGAPPSSVLPPA